MNYLLHFVMDHQPANHEFNTGLLLPDITRRWIKTFKRPPPVQEFPAHAQQILLGCLKHYESDKKFHVSAFFNQYYTLLKEAIGDAHLSDQTERKWFVAHVMLELLLDRVIVRDRVHLTDLFYESLLKVDEQALSFLLKCYGMQNDEAFFTFFNHFRNSRYIYFYTDNKKFTYSLMRIMMRAGLKEPPEDDGKKLEKVLTVFEKEHFSDPAVMLDELKKILE